MKYKLDTIPVWDAYMQDSECPLCILEHKCETAYVDFFLDESVMEPDIRVEVNEYGFCHVHYRMLFNAKNRLGLALITHTHMKSVMNKFERYMVSAEKTAEKTINTSASKKGLIERITGRGSSIKAKIRQLNKWLSAATGSCIICKRIENTVDRYAYTILHLWRNDKDFKKILLESKGFCLSHFHRILKIAGEILPSGTLAHWLKDITPVQKKSLDRLEEELLWFTKKFDYRNKDKPWGSSKDALPRTLQKLSGKPVKEKD